MKGRNSQRKRIDHVGVQKHRVSTRTRESSGILRYLFSSQALEKLKIFAFRVNDELDRIACKWHLVPYEYQGARSFKMASIRGRLLHYSFLLAWFVLILIRFEGLFRQIATNEGAPGVPTFICATSVCVSTVSFCLAFAGLWVPQKTIDLFYFIEQTQLAIGTDLGCQVTYKKSLSVALKVISVSTSVLVISVDDTLLGLVTTDLPVFAYPVLNRTGIIPQGVLSDFTWALIVLPLDWTTNLLPCIAAAFSGNLMMTSIGAYSACLLVIKDMPRRTVEEHRRVQRLMLNLQVYNQVLAHWVRVFLPPALSSLSSGFVVVAYVAVRGDQLPIPVYICFPIVGFFLMGMIFWLSYDGMMFKRMSDGILGGLRSRSSEYLRALERDKKNEIVKRAKALRAASVSIGGFGELSFDLPVNIWEENLDQLLVLLTL